MSQHEGNETHERNRQVGHVDHAGHDRDGDAAHAGAREPVSGVFRIQPQPSVIERIDALTARMRSAVSFLSQNRPRDGRDD